ncbi:MAG: hypothetical protein NUV57_03740, partial [archaeon]|nr:hypothetical protein [archaeon]
AQSPLEMGLNLFNFNYIMGDSQVERLQNSARNQMGASLDEIAQGAGFTSRKAIQYYFGTRKNLFKSIGIEITKEKPKEKLIEAAKSLFYNSSAREIAKKAGYKSHKIINIYFDSLENLKRIAGKYECNKEKINFKGVEFSLQDVSRGVTIPQEINELVAEEAGWHAGDGSLFTPYTGVEYNYQLGGDPNEEIDFYKYISLSIKKIYNLGIKPKLLSKGNLLGLVVSSKAVFTYKKYLGFPVGDKANIIETPSKILNSKNKKIKAAFIRGLADTDFSLVFNKKHKTKHYYPTIVGALNSKILIEQVFLMLKELGFRPSKRTIIRKDKNTQYGVFLQGNEQLEKWIKEISFNNSKHTTKYLVWKKFGFCPAKTKIKERYLMLEGKLNPNLFYKRYENA